jgi:hypothetical protein
MGGRVVTDTDPIPEVAAEVHTALRLLLEYTPKLREWIRDARATTGGLHALVAPASAAKRIEELTDRFDRIRPACQDLSQMASGLIEQSRADFSQRTELRLRLAEFENALVTLGKLLAQEPVSRGKK